MSLFQDVSDMDGLYHHHYLFLNNYVCSQFAVILAYMVR